MSTPNINTKVLEEAINEVKDANFQAQMREWLVMGAPREVSEIWARYCDKMQSVEERKEQQREEFLEGQANAAKWAGFFVFLACVAVVIWASVNTYELVTTGCVR